MTLTPKQALVADALIDFMGSRGVKIQSHDELLDYIIEAKRINHPPPQPQDHIVNGRKQSNERRTSTAAQRQDSQRAKDSPGHV